MTDNFHIPVLLNKVLEYLINPLIKNHLIVDCTVGGGGHSLEIAKKIFPDGKLICIDRDENAIDYAKRRFQEEGIEAEFLKGNFANLIELLETKNIKSVTGILVDLGLSTYQLEKEDGFSFMRNTALDMRVDKSQNLRASDILNNFNKNQLESIFKEFGEIKNYKKITSLIINSRKFKQIKTTSDFVEILQRGFGKRLKESFLAKVFQSLRIYVNNELDNLKKVLENAIELLTDNGRLVIISYHSLEDRIVKSFFKEHSFEKKYLTKDKYYSLKILTKKPIVPDLSEIRANKKSRSAKLRAAELTLTNGKNSK